LPLCRYRHNGNLIKHMHSSAVRLDELNALWTRIVLKLFPSPIRVNGRPVLVADGIKAPKRGKKMPGVKLLHQQSECNNKSEYITGHSIQAVCVLVQVLNSVLAVPLGMRIHEGLVWSNRDRRTLLDKLLSLIDILAVSEPFYLVADAYYAAGKMAEGLLADGNHLITRVKSNAVAYELYVSKGPSKRGRPRLYGQKIALKTLLNATTGTQQLPSPVYGEQDVILSFVLRDLLWRPTGRLARFVAVTHPSRGSCLLMSTDTTLSAADIIRLYGLRFKIEHTFKQAVRSIGTFAYHFWMKHMKPLRRRSGNQHLHRESQEYRDGVKRKIHAYHVFMQAGVISQGLLQYLAAVASTQVWSSFGSWLRTIRPGVAPSEFVVAGALRNTLPEFLLNSREQASIAKFIGEKQNLENMEMFGVVA
jgi:Transposase DDE domain